MAQTIKNCPVCLRQQCVCQKKHGSASIHWILRLDDDFEGWLDSLSEVEREKVKTVLRGIERSSAMPWDYIEVDASVTQNIDDIDALHELHLRCFKRDLVIVFTVVKRNILFVDYGTLRELRQRSILSISAKRLPRLLAALEKVIEKEVSHVQDAH